MQSITGPDAARPWLSFVELHLDSSFSRLKPGGAKLESVAVFFNRALNSIIKPGRRYCLNIDDNTHDVIWAGREVLYNFIDNLRKLFLGQQGI